ncbi:hypothetical protein TMatcc_003203 [Talaromyces marneffei ATCC 18224]
MVPDILSFTVGPVTYYIVTGTTGQSHVCLEQGCARKARIAPSRSSRVTHFLHRIDSTASDASDATRTRFVCNAARA